MLYEIDLLYQSILDFKTPNHEGYIVYSVRKFSHLTRSKIARYDFVYKKGGSRPGGKFQDTF